MEWWDPLPEGLPGWSAEYPIHGWSARTTAIRLSAGDLLVVNPGRTIAEQARRELSSIGRVSYLLAPNQLHYLGVTSWRELLGAVPLLVAPDAEPRLTRRLGFRPTVLAAGTPSLPAGIEIVVPEGTKTGEVWVTLRAAKEVAWVVGDAFFHLPRTPRNAPGLFLLATGTTPGLRIGNTFKWGHLRDRAAYRAWIMNRLKQDPPTILIPAHGEVLQDARLAARLQALVATRLG